MRFELFIQMKIRGILIVLGVLLVVCILCAPEEDDPRLRMLETYIKQQKEQMDALIRTQELLHKTLESIDNRIRKYMLSKWIF